MRLSAALDGGIYDGVFLDRIRFPAPFAGPEYELACFCEDCVQAAGEDGLDLAILQHQIRALMDEPRRMVRALFRDESEPLSKLLEFRSRSITRTVAAAAAVGRQRGLAVGLDCFSPALARAVGQDLAALAPPWIGWCAGRFRSAKRWPVSRRRRVCRCPAAVSNCVKQALARMR